ncbi:hypothetical protein D9M72_262390 [compost metagenome]
MPDSSLWPSLAARNMAPADCLTRVRIDANSGAGPCVRTPQQDRRQHAGAFGMAQDGIRAGSGMGGGDGAGAACGRLVGAGCGAGCGAGWRGRRRHHARLPAAARQAGQPRQRPAPAVHALGAEPRARDVAHSRHPACRAPHGAVRGRGRRAGRRHLPRGGQYRAAGRLPARYPHRRLYRAAPGPHRVRALLRRLRAVPAAYLGVDDQVGDGPAGGDAGGGRQARSTGPAGAVCARTGGQPVRRGHGAAEPRHGSAGRLRGIAAP